MAYSDRRRSQQGPWLSVFIPAALETWNYAGAYVVLMMFVPLHDGLLRNLSKNEFQKLLTVFSLCWRLVPTTAGKASESNCLLWLFVAYSAGPYIRLYPNKLTENAKPALIGTAVSYLLYVLPVIVLDILGIRFSSPLITPEKFGSVRCRGCLV